MFCWHKWVVVKQHKNVYKRYFTFGHHGSWGPWVKDGDENEKLCGIPDAGKRYATSSVCVKCGKCGGTIIQAMKAIRKDKCEKQKLDAELELARKIYDDNCGDKS